MSNVTDIRTFATTLSRSSRLGRSPIDSTSGVLGADEPDPALVRRKRGQILQQRNDVDRWAYVVHDGWLGSRMVSRRNNRAFIALHFPGDLVGIADVLADRQSCEMHALSDVSVRLIGRTELSAQFADEAASLALAKSLANEIHAMSSLLASLINRDARGRIAALALHIVERLAPAPVDSAVTIPTPLTQTDIADLTGITAVHVNRTIRSLREDEIVDWRARSLVVTDPARLRQYVTRQVCGQR